LAEGSQSPSIILLSLPYSQARSYSHCFFFWEALERLEWGCEAMVDVLRELAFFPTFNTSL
jgi:hypothetical protein